LNTDWDLIGIQGEQSHDGCNRQFLVMNPGEAVDTGKPQAEEFVGPSFRLEHVKGQNLRKSVWQALMFEKFIRTGL